MSPSFPLSTIYWMEEFRLFGHGEMWNSSIKLWDVSKMQQCCFRCCKEKRWKRNIENVWQMERRMEKRDERMQTDDDDDRDHDAAQNKHWWVIKKLWNMLLPIDFGRWFKWNTVKTDNLMDVECSSSILNSHFICTCNSRENKNKCSRCTEQSEKERKFPSTALYRLHYSTINWTVFMRQEVFKLSSATLFSFINDYTLCPTLSNNRWLTFRCKIDTRRYFVET